MTSLSCVLNSIIFVIEGEDNDTISLHVSSVLFTPKLPSLLSPPLLSSRTRLSNFVGVSKVVELEKFLASGGTPSDVRALITAERSKTEIGNVEVEVEVVVEDAAVKEVEVVLLVDMTAEADVVATVEDIEDSLDKISAVPSPQSSVQTDAA